MAVAGRLYGPEWRRYPDPATEFDVIRLTDPAAASGLTAPQLRQFSRRGNFLLHWSERSGSKQAYTIDLKSGESRQVTDAEAVDGSSLTLSSDERSVMLFSGGSLLDVPLGSLQGREIYKASEGVTRSPLSVATDGTLWFAELRDLRSQIVGVSRVRTAPLGFAVDGQVDLVLARPRHAQVLYSRSDGIFLAGLDGSAKKRLKVEAGQNPEILWSPTGHSFIYLHVPDDPKQLISLRENFPDEGDDKLLARTSQFAGFSMNNDTSVFTGASRSKASAYVLILLRVTRRELTLCEHKASDPAMVRPSFSPDSQSVFFASDRHGKSALYRVHVEKFVEQTDDDR